MLDFNNTDDQGVDWFQAFSLENIVVPAARLYGLTEEYEYLRPSIKRFATGVQHYMFAFGVKLVAMSAYDAKILTAPCRQAARTVCKASRIYQGNPLRNWIWADGHFSCLQTIAEFCLPLHVPVEGGNGYHAVYFLSNTADQSV